MSIVKYLDAVKKHYDSGLASEHTYRGDLASLIKSLSPSSHITNEPSNVTECGNPDFVVTRKNVPVGFIEAKDIGKNLDSKLYTEQFARYKKALDNLIITDYLNFRFFQRGEQVAEIRIAEVYAGKVKALPENFEKFTNLLNEFCLYVNQTIKSPKVLAQMMAAKARLLENILEKAVLSDEENVLDTSLKQQYETFKQILIHDLTPKGFADIYAQTLAYGMFAARLHDRSLDTFNRREAAELIPKTNPFLRRLFDHVAGVNIDERIVTTVDNLAEVFRATNVSELLKNFGRTILSQDPVIHFYETFLSEYDPSLRKARGVWYTPAPVVEFILKGVDDILKTEFKLKDGLADTTKTTIKVQTDKKDHRTKSGYVSLDKEIHRVQILDPATGTGTFLAEAIKYIYGQKFKNMQGAWSSYVEDCLIPRLNGFEILMASYAMAHLKLDMLLTETGYKSVKNKRFNIFLTNSLEEHHPDTGTLFSSWLSSEANEANRIKKDAPVMVVMGNPPYSGLSQNNGDWISNLINDYKYIDGEHFGERKHWLNDDYVKFIRLGQAQIEKTGEGVLAYINNHSFIDNPTFRGMRWNLLQAFDEIFILDLQGDTNKINLAPKEAGSDENVFDIQKGVSINFFIKHSSKKASTNAKVNYAALWGGRENKYKVLSSSRLKDIEFLEVLPQAPNYFFSPADYGLQEQYLQGFAVSELFREYTMGFASAQDRLTVSFDSNALWDVVSDFKNLSIPDLREKYLIKKESRDWTIASAKQDIENNYSKSLIRKVSYRPFDERFTYYTGNSRGFYASPQKKIMRHLEMEDNLAFISCRMNRDNSDTYWVAENIVSKSLISSLDNCYVFPLYLYLDSDSDGNIARTPNFNEDIVSELASATKLNFSPEPIDSKGSFSPVDVVDYIYAYLHCEPYLKQYRPFLKVDFPRVPYPESKKDFFSFVQLGKKLRTIHLMSDTGDWDPTVCFSQAGSGLITRKIGVKDFEITDKKLKLGRVWINESQYFSGVPETIWNYNVGGYSPAQKWLKDRVGQVLSYEDLSHYQRIICALIKAQKVMEKINSAYVISAT